MHDVDGSPCRRAANAALTMMVKMLKDKAVDGAIAVGDMEAVLRTLVGTQTSSFCRIFAEAERNCLASHELEIVKRLRSDAFGRLVVHQFAPLLEDGSLSRAVLANFFNALKLILGDQELSLLHERAARIVSQMREAGNFIWDDFYVCEDAQIILEETLVKIARAFRRFDVRRDWFMKIMTHTPASVSLGPNAFVALKREKIVFGEQEFVALMSALFASMRPRTLSVQRQKRLGDRFGESPARIFGPVFDGLAAMGARE